VLAPPQLLGMESVTPLTVTLRVTVKTRPGRQWAVQRGLNQRILASLAQFDDLTPSPENMALLAQPDILTKQ
jgi:small-conductance mechanosensitive channel